MTRDEMRAYLESAPEAPTSDDDEEAYDQAGRLAGKIVLEYLDAHPADADLDFWDLTAKIPALHGHGFTGFMVGYAVNAAKYVIGGKPTINPAIMNVAAPDE